VTLNPRRGSIPEPVDVEPATPAFLLRLPAVVKRQQQKSK
jgi:hypothetical protein